MQEGEQGSHPPVGQYLPDIALPALVEFLVQGGFAPAKEAGQGTGGDEERQQENSPLPAAQPKGDRPDQQGAQGAGTAEAAGTPCQEGDGEGSQEAKQELGQLWVHIGVVTMNMTAARNKTLVMAPKSQMIWASRR
jgi:hypothetical protein